MVASPEMLNPEFKEGSLYPNTFESGKFCSVNDSFNKSGYFPPAFLYFFGNIFTLVKILSWLKRLTSCGYLHLVVDTSLQNPCSYSRLLISIRDHFRCEEDELSQARRSIFTSSSVNVTFCGIWIHSLLLFGKLVKLTNCLINVSA